MFYGINKADYDLTSRDVAEILNGGFSSVFKKDITSSDVIRWTTNYELNAIKGEEKRWRYRKEDIQDFIYRYQHDLLHKFNSSYHRRTNCRVPDNILREFFQEERIFQIIICILVTINPYALHNDPDRHYQDIGRAEGGIIFKNAAIHFSTWSVGPKTSEIDMRQQRLLYPVLVAQAINQLVDTYNRTDGFTVQKKLLEAGWILVNNRISYDQYLHEVTNTECVFRGWSGLNSNLHNQIHPVHYIPMRLGNNEIM